MRQRTLPQPRQKLRCIFSKYDALQVWIHPTLFINRAFADGDEGQIMVAQDDLGVLAQAMHQPQCF
jgi:hypothetical protein